MKVHHVGYLVGSIDEAKPEFEALGYVSDGEASYDSMRGIEILFMRNGEEYVELVSPVTINAASSVVAKLYKKIGSAPYHICYTCNNLEKKIKELCDGRGYTLLHPPAEAPAIFGRKVAFLYQIHIGMIELLEV